MKKYPRNIGLFLIIIGTLLFVATRFHAFANANWPLLTGLILIIVGIVLHIRSIKHESGSADF